MATLSSGCSHVRQTNPAGRQLTCGICFLLAVITIVLYWPVRNFQFNNYDDAQYLTQNPHVQDGLTGRAIGWAFTTDYAGNWHPLTWISHLADVQIFGFNAGGHHLTNLAFHVANVFLLFFVLQSWTGFLWRAAFVTGLFAWHPLHVESVAWVAERKDVLSTFFWLLTMLAYGKYCKPRDGAGWRFYLLALLFFALGLLCKPMLVSLPLILLLLDYWPLGRIKLPLSGGNVRPLLLEKIPFFVLAAVSCLVTLVVQKKGGAVQPLENLALSDRVSNAVVSYARYLGKIFWPVDLAVIYPYSRHLPSIEVFCEAVLLLAICWVVAQLAKTHPPLLVGWLWFLITLVPVIGLVQVGDQALADRYTYVPSIGIFVLIAWEAPRLLIPLEFKIPLSILAVLALGACLVVASRQLRYWRNSVTLFTHAIDVTKNNCVAECNLGLALASLGQTKEAIAHEERAIEINPADYEAQNNLGILLEGEGKWDDASRHLLDALQAKPDCDQAYYNLGVISVQQGRMEEAAARFRAAISINPEYDKAMVNLGVVLAQQGHLDDAITQYRAALAIAQNNTYAHNALGRALEARNQLADAAAQYADAIACNAGFVPAYINLGWLLATAPEPKLRDATEALRLADLATQLAPGDPAAWDTQAAAFAEGGHYKEAIAAATKALKLAAGRQKSLAGEIQARLRLYQVGAPYHQKPKP